MGSVSAHAYAGMDSSPPVVIRAVEALRLPVAALWAGAGTGAGAGGSTGGAAGGGQGEGHVLLSACVRAALSVAHNTVAGPMVGLGMALLCCIASLLVVRCALLAAVRHDDCIQTFLSHLQYKCGFSSLL